MIRHESEVRGGFTLTEMLVSMAVGMFVLNIAFASFFFTQKFIRKTEMMATKNEVLQSQIEWVLTGRAPGSFPNTAQSRLVGGSIVASGIDRYDLVVSQFVNATTTTPKTPALHTIAMPKYTP